MDIFAWGLSGKSSIVTGRRSSDLMAIGHMCRSPVASLSNVIRLARSLGLPKGMLLRLPKGMLLRLPKGMLLRLPKGMLMVCLATSIRPKIDQPTPFRLHSGRLHSGRLLSGISNLLRMD